MLKLDLLPNLLVNMLVATVMIATLVDGPFYLGLGLGLKETVVGFVIAIGPIISILSGVPYGRLFYAWGNSRILTIGLAIMATGAFLLALIPNMIGVVGYVLALIVLTPGYQLFRSANNTAALANVRRDHERPHLTE